MDGRRRWRSYQRSRVVSDAVPDNDWKPGAQYAAGPRRPREGLPIHIPNNGERVRSVYRAGQVTIVNNAQTGLSTVDERTESLKTILERVVNSRAEGSGPEYGTAIHTDFAKAVRSENLRGIGRKGVEQTFGQDPDEPNVPYGTKGSVRTDIVLRNDAEDVIAIYDVKTGSANLGPRRVQELRMKTGASSMVPIIEMHIRRGLSLKARTKQGSYVWTITLRLWNPWIRGSFDPGVGEGAL